MYQVLITPLDGSKSYWYRFADRSVAKYSTDILAREQAETLRDKGRVDVIFVNKRTRRSR